MTVSDHGIHAMGTNHVGKLRCIALSSGNFQAEAKGLFTRFVGQ